MMVCVGKVDELPSVARGHEPLHVAALQAALGEQRFEQFLGQGILFDPLIADARGQGLARVGVQQHRLDGPRSRVDSGNDHGTLLLSLLLDRALSAVSTRASNRVRSAGPSASAIGGTSISNSGSPSCP